MSRAKNKPEDNRKQFQVRFTEDEKRILNAASKSKGLPMASWIRVVCLEAAKTQIGGG